MRSVVIEKPYQFIPPHRGDGWPTWIQRLKLFDIHLRRKDGVIGYEIRHAERLAECLKKRESILLAPNHCRYADPLVVGWLAREVKTHVFAMASWHLFNEGWFDAFSIRRMGGFSIWREGSDRQAIETAVDVLVEARRPLILFAEGSAHLSNDRLQPLLDGVSFIARTAARRRAKENLPRVVTVPIAIKYVFQGDIHAWANQSLEILEERLTWRPRTEATILERITRVAEGLLSVKEVEYLGAAQQGRLAERQEQLVEALLQPIESEYLGKPQAGPAIPRVKALRPRLVPTLLVPETPESLRRVLRRQLHDLDLVQQLAAYPHDYLTQAPVTETRVLETLERFEEDLLDRKRWPGPLKAIIEVGEPIEVPAERAARKEGDPLLDQLAVSLGEMLGRLQHESRLYQEVSPA